MIRGLNYKDYVNNGLNEINSLVQSLTNTIDDFRNFHKPNKLAVSISLQEICEKSVSIIKQSLISDKIELKYEINSVKKIKIYDNELIQAILNIIKNAQDNFKEKNIANPSINITIDDHTIIICDNGGGIDNNIIGSIFDPYFSTKNEKNGTGLGLYMSKTIVEDHHGGNLSVINTHDGVCFKIDLKEEFSR